MRRVVQIFLLFILLFIFQTAYAQKVVLEYFKGRELVIYTPDYKLILLEELEFGDEIPVGSIIETGRKSTCEIRLVPNGSMIKVGDRTTFKIQELQVSDNTGKNEFKLISGAMRAVVSRKTGLEQYSFLSGSSTVFPEKADFGITVKKGWEEKVFVLESSVKYVNAKGVEIFVSANQMASGLDDDFRAIPISVRMKRLANTLAFERLNPKDVSLEQGMIPVLTAAPTETPIPTESIPVVTPWGTDAPIIQPTPTPFQTEPTPGPDEYSTESTEIQDEGFSEKSSVAFDPDREELYPEDAYVFTAKYSYPYNFRIDEVGDEFITISYAIPEKEEETEQAEQAEEAEVPELPQYTLLEIYNVFEKKENLKGKDAYSGFIDSVVLIKVEERIFYFAYLWQGARKNIQPGFYLYPTGRIYNPEEDTIIVLPEEEKPDEEAEGEEVTPEGDMDFSGDRGMESTSSGDEPPVGFNFDMGWDITFGVFNVDTGIEGLDFFANIWMFLSSLRGRYFINPTIKFTNWFGIGADLGIATGYVTLNDIDIYFLDFPLRGYLRFGTRDAYIQPFCGWYFSFQLPAEGEFESAYIDGLDVGAAVSLWGFYLQGSYVFGNFIGHMDYYRFGMGMVFNDILGTGK